MNWLKFLTGLAAVLVAGCAAYFSVTGLGVLFSGASFAVMLMAGSLEFAKLVSATYLKQRWKDISGLNKWYLTSAVVILMIITSAGIFGFLSNAFQQQNIRIEQVEREISVWDTKINNSKSQVESLNLQITNLQNNQGKIIEGGKVNNRLLRSVDKRDAEVSKLQTRVNSLQDSILSYSERINTIKNNNIHLEREIGGFRFVAESFNLPLNSVVKFFIILIVFVFDPLAIALVIAFNSMVSSKNKKIVEKNIQNDDDSGKKSTEDKETVDDGGKKVNDDPQVVDAKDIISEVSKVRLSEDQLIKIEDFLNKKEYQKPEKLDKKYDKEIVETESTPLHLSENDLNILEKHLSTFRKPNDELFLAKQEYENQIRPINNTDNESMNVNETPLTKIDNQVVNDFENQDVNNHSEIIINDTIAEQVDEIVEPELNIDSPIVENITESEVSIDNSTSEQIQVESNTEDSDEILNDQSEEKKK